MRKYKKNLSSFKEALFKSSSRLGLNKGLSKYGLWDNWNKIVPKTISKHTRPVRWQGDILVVGTTTSAWTQELTFLKPELITKITAYDPKIKIKDIWFETGHSFEINKKSNSEKPSTKIMNPENLKKIDEWTSDIKDSELKETVKNALCSVFLRKK